METIAYKGTLGYWLPFDAAKALAATFCYDVRYALTPLFGTDFISLCILPSDPDFARITIDSAIVKHSTEVANRLYDLSKTVSQACDQQTPSPYSLPKSASQKRRVGQVKTVAEENKFGTDKDCSDEDMDSPKTRFAEWTPLNAKQSAAPQKCDQSSPETKSTNRVLRSADSPKGLERKKSHRNKQISDSDQAEFPFQSSAETYDPLGQRIEPSGSIEDIQAAEILLLLSREDAALTNRRC